MNPDSFTLRELLEMERAKGCYDWKQTAALILSICSIFGDNDLTEEDINPYLEPAPVQKVDMSILREIFKV